MSNQYFIYFELFLEIKLYKKLIGLLVRKGYKNKALIILNNVLFIIMQKLKLSFSYIVFSFFNKLQTSIEVRRVVRKGKSFLVPFKIKFNRQIYLITKWILKAIEENKTEVSINAKILEVFLALYTKKNSKVLQYKENNYKQALLNKSNLHYRW